MITAQTEIAEVATQVGRCVVKWLRRHGYLNGPAEQEVEPTAIEACMRVGLAPALGCVWSFSRVRSVRSRRAGRSCKERRPTGAGAVWALSTGELSLHTEWRLRALSAVSKGDVLQLLPAIGTSMRGSELSRSRCVAKIEGRGSTGIALYCDYRDVRTDVISKPTMSRDARTESHDAPRMSERLGAYVSRFSASYMSSPRASPRNRNSDSIRF